MLGFFYCEVYKKIKILAMQKGNIYMINREEERERTNLPFFCDLCCSKGMNLVVAEYDAKSKYGPWAYMCESCFKEYGIGLGIGKGFKIIKEKKMDDTTMDALPYLTKWGEVIPEPSDPLCGSKSYWMMLKELNTVLQKIEELDERMNRTQEYLRIGEYADGY